MAKLPTSSDLKHRVMICTSQDVVVDGTTLVLARKGVRETWAMVAESREQLFARDGMAIREQRDAASHKITIRYNPDQPITSAAWVYEARLKSEPRWYKVLAISDLGEQGRFSVLRCRLVEKSDGLLAPAPKAATPADPATGGMFAPVKTGALL